MKLYFWNFICDGISFAIDVEKLFLLYIFYSPTLHFFLYVLIPSRSGQDVGGSG